MNIQVESYEAETKLPEMLRGIQAGNRYTITFRGEAVANLVPPEHKPHADAAAGVAAMHAFMDAAMPVADSDLKALIEDGRA